jgi:hypothetical protein
MMQITRCPPAFCGPSIQAQPLPKADRQQLAAHYQKQEERREAKRKTSLAQRGYEEGARRWTTNG